MEPEIRNEKPIEIVLEGGPCGGKTSAHAHLTRKLSDYGFRVIFVPEVATDFIGGGIPDIARIASEDRARYRMIQEQILLEQFARCERYLALAKVFSDQRTVILYDRGPMSIKAYTTDDEFAALTKTHGLTLHELRDRFDGVIHLVTAAEGAEAFYTLANNLARHESPTEARALDAELLRAWIGHPHLRIIDNSTDFDGKMRRTLQTACRMLGIPVPLEIERKFLLRGYPNLSSEGLRNAVRSHIEQIYLVEPTGARIRKRTQGDSSTYSMTVKRRISDLVREEREDLIDVRDYYSLAKLRKPGSRTIVKDRYCFVYKNQYFELDIMKCPKQLAFLEIELTEEHDAVELPPFLEIEREVTSEPEFSNARIACAT